MTKWISAERQFGLALLDRLVSRPDTVWRRAPSLRQACCEFDGFKVHVRETEAGVELSLADADGWSLMRLHAAGYAGAEQAFVIEQLDKLLAAALTLRPIVAPAAEGDERALRQLVARLQPTAAVTPFDRPAPPRERVSAAAARVRRGVGRLAGALAAREAGPNLLDVARQAAVALS